MYSIRANPQQRFVYGPFDIRRITFVPDESEHAINTHFLFKRMEHKKYAMDAQTPFQVSEDDGILTLVQRGSMVSENTLGERILLSPQQVMWSTDGKTVKRSESTPLIAAEIVQIHFDFGGVVSPPGTQIYQRTAQPEHHNEWLLLLSNAESNAPLQINQPLEVYDAKITAGQQVTIPTKENHLTLLYVIEGEIEVAGECFYAGDLVIQPLSPFPDAITTLHSSLLCIIFGT